MSESGARNRRMVVSGGFSRASDFSSNESRLRRNGRVVLVLSWPSQSPMTLNGTPDRGGRHDDPLNWYHHSIRSGNYVNI